MAAPRKRATKKAPETLKVDLKGREEPTIFTPPLRKLTRETTLGFECIDFAEKVLGVQLYPWQKWLLIHALELKPNGKFRFRTVIVMVARQNGKSRLLQILSLWRMYVDGAPLVIGTAQNLDVAEELWSAAIDLAQENDDLAAEIKHIDRTNGKKALRLTTGERYKVAAANRKGGRGLSGDLILMDELREHSNWDSWSAVTKTTMARAKPQVWAASNAGDASSVVLRHLRKASIRSIIDGDHETASVGLFEWAAVKWDPKGGDDQKGDYVNMKTSDREGWAMANPSLEWGDLTVEALQAAWETDPDPVFRTECLCQWISTAAMGPWEDGLWDSLKDKQSRRASKTEPFVYGIDVSWDRNWTAITVATRREDGTIHAEVVAYRTGTDWAVGWLAERKDQEGLIGVALQENGSPVGSILAELIQAKVNVIGWTGGELGKGTGQFYDLVRQRGIRHRDQEALNLAASTAQTKPVADYWLWDRKRSPFDISPLIALNAAVWALLRPEEEKSTSAYDDDELMFV